MLSVGNEANYAAQLMKYVMIFIETFMRNFSGKRNFKINKKYKLFIRHSSRM